MKRLFTLLSFAVLTLTIGNSQIVISEIMYNSPESLTDSLEYIELYNAGEDSINLEGFSFSKGVEFTFPDTIFAPESFIVVAVDSVSMGYTFGIKPFQWDSGALSNGGEEIVLIDTAGTELDALDYGTSSPWPNFAEGTSGAGASIEFCFDADDNSIGENWRASTTETGDTINAFLLRGTPGEYNTANCGNDPVADVILSGVDFTPADITINIGETVKWKNTDGFHNINGTLETYPDNPEGFGNGAASSDTWEWEYTFTKEGVYDYRCDPHFDLDMVGTVTVINDIPNLVITEIMYNDPSSDDIDSLEFIEVYNAGSDSVNLEGIILSTNVINFSLPDVMIASGEFFILQKQSSVLVNSHNLMTIPWAIGGLNNNSDNITLKTADGDIIDSVTYQDVSPWPEPADGLGYSLSLCSRDLDNSDPANWQVSSTPTEVIFENDIVLHADLGAFNTCSWSIASATEIDTNGQAVRIGQDVRLQGIVYGINYRPSGLQFTIIDMDNNGIGVFSASENFEYTVTEGDELVVMGEIGQFNGLTQIYLDSLMLLNSNSELIASDTVTVLNEETESSLVTIKDVTLVDPSEWGGSGSGFNVTVSDGTNEYQVRIDADVTALFEGTYPTGTFTITGIGGQFDNESPFDDGYQLFPRYAADIEPYLPYIEEFPLKSIQEVTMNNEDGSAVSDGLKCELVGVTYGINLRPSGLQFTIIDENNDGIGVFVNSGNLNYSYAEGDEISVRGSISQFNGLTQINPDSIRVISSENEQFAPTDTQVLGEATESQLVKITNVKVVDPSQWSGDGSSFNVDLETAEGITLVMRIDSDVDLANMLLPGETIDVTGIGGQFDSEAPYDGGYQLLPRYASDIDVINNTNDLYLSEGLIKLFPNPASDLLKVQGAFDYEVIRIYNATGQLLRTIASKSEVIDISGIPQGNYFLQFISKKGIVQKELMKF